MRAIVDTHALLWWIGGEQGRLSRAQVDFLRDPANELLWSVMSTVEIGALVAKQKLELDRPLMDWCRHWIQRLGMGLLPVEHDHALRCAQLDRHHGDPIDRILVAQALALDAVIVSRDRALRRYPARFIV